MAKTGEPTPLRDPWLATALLIIAVIVVVVGIIAWLISAGILASDAGSYLIKQAQEVFG